MARAGACIQVRSSLYPFSRRVQLDLFHRINAAERGGQRVAQGNMAGPQTTCMQQATLRMGSASSSACRSCVHSLSGQADRCLPAAAASWLLCCACRQTYAQLQSPVASSHLCRSWQQQQLLKEVTNQTMQELSVAVGDSLCWSNLRHLVSVVGAGDWPAP